jgi:uncharacterized repeat protein (TIGR03803 family)
MRNSRLATFSLVLLFLPAMSFSQAVNEVFSFSNTHSSAGPEAVVPIQGHDGAIYGTTSGYGHLLTDGAVFRIAAGGTFSALHTFSGTDGQDPVAGLTLGMDGNFYGTAAAGGRSGKGVLFKVAPSGAYTVLYEFTGGSDGANPFAQPIQASDGNFYGTTQQGSNNAGTVYRYSPSTGAFATIFALNADESDGTEIKSSLIEGSDGNLYGVASYGGSFTGGTLFELNRSGTLLQLYNFPGGTGGSAPFGNLVQASDGSFYGTTAGGGISDYGTVFRMSGGAVSILYSFAGPPNDGEGPFSGLVEGTDGNLYGTTYGGGAGNQSGTIYQINPTGQYRNLYSFFSKMGRYPVGGLSQHTNGKFYGTAFNGGTYGEGSLYSLNMGLGPFIALVRYTGRIGQPVQILGQGLTGATAVTVNGVAAASFKVVSDTYMTAVVPTGATTGPVVVTTATGTLTSNHSFRIVQ